MTGDYKGVSATTGREEFFSVSSVVTWEWHLVSDLGRGRRESYLAGAGLFRFPKHRADVHAILDEGGGRCLAE